MGEDGPVDDRELVAARRLAALIDGERSGPEDQTELELLAAAQLLSGVGDGPEETAKPARPGAGPRRVPSTRSSLITRYGLIVVSSLAAMFMIGVGVGGSSRDDHARLDPRPVRSVPGRIQVRLSGLRTRPPERERPRVWDPGPGRSWTSFRRKILQGRSVELVVRKVRESERRKPWHLASRRG